MPKAEADCRENAKMDRAMTVEDGWYNVYVAQTSEDEAAAVSISATDAAAVSA